MSHFKTTARYMGLLRDPVPTHSCFYLYVLSETYMILRVPSHILLATRGLFMVYK